MVVRYLGFIFALGALWNLYATFRGVAILMDLPMEYSLNPWQFTFAIIISLVICAAVAGSAYIWTTAGKDLVGKILKYIWLIWIVTDFFISVVGTHDFIFYGDREDLGRITGVVLITLLMMSASVLSAKMLLTKDVKGKPFIF